MTLPKSKARSITIAGQRYRWAVGRVDGRFEQRLHVEREDVAGARLVCRFAARLSSDDTPITPARVRGIVQRALHLGWAPDRRGPDFALDACIPRERTFPDWATSAPSSGQEPLSLESWTNFDPPRHGFPWEHHVDVFPRFRVWEGMTDIQVGTVFADAARHRDAVPGGNREKVLRALLLPLEDEDEATLVYSLDGGRVLRRGTEILMDQGCCTSLDEWVEWRTFLDGGHRPWNGHDPFSSAERVGDRVRFLDGDRVLEEVDTETYARLLAGFEADLAGFVRRAGKWLDRHAPEALRAPVLDVLARTLHVAGR